MKKLLAALTALFVLALAFVPSAYAGNVATAQTALPIRVHNVGPVIPYIVTFDTTATDLTIRTPGSSNMVCIVGWDLSEGTASNVTLTSGSTAYPNLELAANQGIIGGSFFPPFCTQPGEALKMQVSAAVTGMILYVIEAAFINIGGY